MQFQITINFVALIVAFVAAVSNGETPLNVLQLLWVNLIMDSLAALGGLCSSVFITNGNIRSARIMQLCKSTAAWTPAPRASLGGPSTNAFAPCFQSLKSAEEG